MRGRSDLEVEKKNEETKKKILCFEVHELPTKGMVTKMVKAPAIKREVVGSNPTLVNLSLFYPKSHLKLYFKRMLFLFCGVMPVLQFPELFYSDIFC